MANWCLGRPARSPMTPPPSSRKNSTMCSGRTISESPTMSSVGAVIARIASSGTSFALRSISVFLAKNVGKWSGSGARLRYSSCQGGPHHLGLHLTEPGPQLGINAVALVVDRGQHLFAHQVRMADSEPQGHGSPVAVAEDVGLRDVQIPQECGRVLRQELEVQRAVDVRGAA